MEDIDIGQPEEVIAGARRQAPGEAGESCPVHAIRLERHQDSEDSEQWEKEHGADGAQ
jgi:hypothetical protein